MGMGIEDVDGDGGDGGGASPPSASTAPEGLVMGGEDEEEIEAVFEDGMLSCAGKDWTEIPRRVAELYGAKAKRVDLCYNEIVSLKYIDQFTECEELILDNNCLGDSAIFPSLPLLNTLTLNKNQIADTEAFLMQIKTCYPKLSFLSLLGNTACPNELVLKDEEDYQRYRYFVLHSLPGLRFLDSRAVTDAERAEAIRVGKFMKVVTISSEDMDAELRRQAAGQQQEVSQFSPLPQEAKSAENHKGTIGTCKYVYFGRHSEGNRFIRNNDL
jgi:hypothetical protein